mgnify:FL=1
MAILSITSIIILLIFQGGFYPYAYLLVALLGGVGIIVSKRSIAITRELGFLFIISLAYLFSSLYNGLSYGTLGQTLLPLACLIMGMVFSLLDDEEKIINNYPAKQEERVNETRIYTYDSLNRMITSKKTDNISQTVSNASYTYDKVGNCTKSIEDGVTTYSTYNSLNQLVQRNVSKNGARVGLTFYSYDANGKQILEQTMVSPPTITETIQKEYDSNNQLMKVTCREGNASGTIKYTQENTYNYDGQRISKTDNGVTTHYYYQEGVLLYTTDNSGNKTSQNVVGPQENVIATIRYEDNGQHTYFYNKNIRTSVTNVVDESGNGVVSYKYDDYGTTIKYGNEDFYNEVCYTSGVYDELTGLYYLNARYYNPESATFITQDSYRGEQDDYGTWNLYAYCGGNPIAYVDLSGHKKKKSVKIPKGYGTTISYMGHHLIKAKSSDQYKLKARAKKDKKYKKKKPEYYAMIDNRILIATKANIGNKLKVSVGDYVNVKFKKSKAKKTVTYKCMIGDIKGADADNSWGHYGGQGVVEIIYHDYNPPKGYKKNKYKYDDRTVQLVQDNWDFALKQWDYSL